ncbi:MAG: hypothetical protein Q9159_002876 [Coniocarpon cinnabarinum]
MDLTNPYINPGKYHGESLPLRRRARPEPLPLHSDPSSDLNNQELNYNATVRLQHGQLYNNRDALDLLAKTANGLPLKRESSSELGSTPERDANGAGGSLPHTTTPMGGAIEQGDRLQYTATPCSEQDPILIWQTQDFIKEGLLSAVEGMHFVDFFYTQMYPLTPIILPNFQDAATHRHLLEKEPILALTILTIAARHCPTPSSGFKAINHATQQRLWITLQSDICGMSVGHDHREGSRSAAKAAVPIPLRTFGMIESLLLLIEWHQSVIHDQPSLVHGGILIKEERRANRPSEASNLDVWRESSSRSDALSWSFLGSAVTLAFELGIFNQDSMSSTYSKRAENIRNLLYIFSIQTSGRLSIPSMIGEHHWAQVTTKPNSPHGDSSNSSQSPSNPAVVSIAPNLTFEETAMHFWFRIAQLFSIGNKMLWPSQSRTLQIVEKGIYADMLDRLAREHEKWRQAFDRCTNLSPSARCVLDIEYYYMRVHGNNIALQAVVQRCTNVTPPEDSDKPIPPEVLEGCMGNDRKFIDMISRDSKQLLNCVMNGLRREKHLTHISSRTFWRIANVSIILLKTLSLGTFRDNFAESLSLLEDAAWALSEYSIDDVHVATDFATSLRSTVARVRANMIRAPVQQNFGRSQKANTDNDGKTGPNLTIDTQQRPGPTLHPPLSGQHLVSPITPKIHPESFARRSVTQPQSKLRQSYTVGSFNSSSQEQYDPSNTPIAVGTGSSPATYAPVSTTQAWSYPPQSSTHPTFTFTQPAGLMPAPPASRHDQAFGPTSFPTPSGTSSNFNYAAFTSSQGHNAMLYHSPSPRQPFDREFFQHSPHFPSPRPHQSFGQDWYGLDVTPLSGRAEVSKSEYGPIVDGQDMLDVMTPNHPPTSANPTGVPYGWGSLSNSS